MSQSLQLGHTFIITNATASWVQCSAQNYLPEFLPMLENVKVISARSEHEAQYPDMDQWKIQAFLQLGRSLEIEAITDIIVVGDSKLEMDAATALSVSFANSF